MAGFKANSLFTAEGMTFRPGQDVPDTLQNMKKLLEAGFVVYDGGLQKGLEMLKAAEAPAEETLAEEKAAKPAEGKSVGRSGRAEK